MNDSGFESKRVRDAMRQYNEPPETPRDRMWSRIKAERAERRVTEVPFSRRFWRSPRLWAPVAAAAVLVLGISIGRYLAPVETNVSAPGGSVAVIDDRGGSPSAGRATDKTNTFQMAAVPVMKSAELLLAEYKAGDTSDENGDSFTSRASALLTDTRLLLDSPAADDPELRGILSDLELILTQIIRLAEEKDERNLIDENIEKRSLIPRLRAKSPAGEFSITA
jgi:hypothetical protein